MLNPDKKVQIAALTELFTNFPAYAKVYHNEVQVDVKEEEIEYIVDQIQDLLRIRKRYEELTMDDMDEVAAVYEKLIQEDPTPAQSIQSYFENYWEPKELEEGSIEQRWKRVMDFIVSTFSISRIISLGCRLYLDLINNDYMGKEKE